MMLTTMFHRSALNTLLVAAGTIALGSFAHSEISANAQQLANKMGATSAVEIRFAPNSTGVTADAKKDLEQTIADAQKKGAIKRIEVAAWSDQEYPAQGTAIAPAQVDLAEQRANNVKSYLKDNLRVSNVDTANMAKRANSLQKIFDTNSKKTKAALENSGAAPTDESQTGLFGSKAQASHAVIMIYNM